MKYIPVQHQLSLCENFFFDFFFFLLTDVMSLDEELHPQPGRKLQAIANNLETLQRDRQQTTFTSIHWLLLRSHHIILRPPGGEMSGFLRRVRITDCFHISQQ